MNFVIWYENDRPKVEWWIDGTKKGVSDRGPGTFTHTGANPYLKIGNHWNGFISHVIIMNPVQQDMTDYFEDISELCGGTAA